MDTMSTGVVADRLGVSVPTVHRAVERLGLKVERTPAGHLRFGARALRALEEECGVLPKLAGLSRPEVQVLVALSRSPVGLRSRRAVARAARLSPTAAGRAVDRLTERGLLRHETRTFAEGEAVVGDLWSLDVTHPDWLGQIEPRLRGAVLPQGEEQERVAVRLPRRFGHLFWNVEPGSLEIGGADAGFVATRLLGSGDIQAVSWAIRNLPREALDSAARNRGMDEATRALVANAAP